MWNSKMRTILGMLTLSVVALMSSCKKDGLPSGPQDTVDRPGVAVAAAMAINSVPASQGLILALDNNQFNNLALGERFAYRELMVYRRVVPGDRLLRVFHPEKVPSNESIFRQDVHFKEGKYYSLFVVGNSDKTMEVVQVEDELNAPSAGRAKIRFINTSPDAPLLDLGLSNETGMLATGMAFKEHSDFISIEASKSYSLTIYNHASKESVLEFNFAPEEKKIYTIVALGRYNQMDYAIAGFGQGIVIH